MSYAAKLIEMAKEAQGYSNTELAVAMGVKQPTVAGWKAGRGSPMSEERVIELCKLAGIKDSAPWLIGVHGEGVRNAEARSALTKLARHLGAAAVVSVAALLPMGNVSATNIAETAQVSSDMHYAKLRRWLRAAARGLQRFLSRFPSDGFDATPALLA